MTPLSTLAALAAKIPEFKRPVRRVCGCRGYVNCPACGGFDDEWDDSPAALLMAVAVAIAKGADVMLLGRTRVSVAREVGPGPVYSDDLPMAEPESIARAAVEALLRAHGVEVPS